jgi:hypothetical protein
MARIKRQPTKWDNCFARNSTDERLYPKYTKSSENQTPKHQIIQLGNGQMNGKTVLWRRNSKD